MRSSLPLLVRRRWPILALTAVALGGATVGYLRLRSAAQELLPGFLKARLETALGRPVEFGALQVWPTGLRIERFRVPRQAGEPADPVVATGIRVSADWWSLVSRRQIVIDQVVLEGARFRLSPGLQAVGKGPWTEQVVKLAGTGIRRFGLRSASVQFLGGKDAHVAWTADDIDGGVRLAPASFNYEARVSRFRAPGVALAGMTLAGAGDAERLTLTRASVGYEGGRLAADGTIRGRDNAADLRVRVDQMPLSNLAARIGIPQEWAVKGKLTGELTVDAQDNALRSIRGTVSVDRGYFQRPGGQLPWESARAKVAWTPERATLSDVRIAGGGLNLVADGAVRTPAGAPFTSGRFELSGRVTASRGAAVARMAELLAFRRVLEGRWEAAGATVAFQAAGTVGDLDSATAGGRLQVKRLRFRPVADQEAVTIDHFAADVKRTPARLVLENVEARTDGFTALGDATLTDELGGKAGRFQVTGSVIARDLKSVQRALPQAALWKWIPIASPTASGKLSFRADGPLDSPADLESTGTFEAHNFRLSATSPLPNGAVFLIPVNTARGTFRHAARQFVINELALDAKSFDATGRVSLDFRSEIALDSDLDIVTDNWRGLPTMPADAFPELQGGHLVANLKQAAPLTELATAPVRGSFLLTEAHYQPGREGVPPIAVERFGADFIWANRVLQVSKLAVATPLLDATAAGRIYEAGGRQYRASLEVSASTSAAGELVQRFTPEVRMTGGRAETSFQMDAPVTELTDAALSGTLELEDATVDYPVETLGLRQIAARRLRTDFSRGVEGWTVTRADIEAPGLTATLRGVVAPDRTDAEVTARMEDWNAPAKLPVTGGRVELAGRIVGETQQLERLAFSGSIGLQDAGLRVSTPEYALEGGKLSLRGALNVSAAQAEAATFKGEVAIHGARGRFSRGRLALREGTLFVQASGAGSLADPATWLQSGSVQLTDAVVVDGARAFPRVERLAASLSRDGERIRWSGAELAAGGATLESAGWWSERGHELDVTAQIGDLAPFGVKLPSGISTRSSNLTVHLSGTPEQLVAAARGRVDLVGVKLAASGVPAQAFERIGGSFHLADGSVRIEDLQGAGPAGSFTVRGTWGEDAQDLTLLVEGKDFTKLGIELPDGFRIGGFRVQGQLSGTAAKPLSRVAGTILFMGAQFPFGPRGPHRLDTVQATLSGAADDLKLTGIKAEGPAGRYAGTGAVTAKGYRLELIVPSMNPDVVRWLLPGEVQGGILSGTLNLAGDDREPIRSAGGHFDLRNARYVAPAAFQVADTATPVNRFTGDYAWDLSGTRLTGLRVESPLLTATGTLTADSSAGTATVDLKTADLGAVVDYWPALKGRLDGGAGSGRLRVAFKGDAAHGTLALESLGGTLHLPGMTGDFAHHPVETASMTLGFEPGRLTFDKVKIRGPKGNADGEGSWSPNGAVFGTGKAWFSKSYTKSLMPKGIGWLASLFGVKEIKSDFTIEGDAEELHLDAAITRSFLWKFAKGRVPREFQAIAQGKAPLWVKPLDVAQAPDAEKPTAAAN